jgi:hypothetical protein
LATQVATANWFVNNGTVSAIAVGHSTGNAECAIAAHINGFAPESSGELALMSSPHLLCTFVTSMDGEFLGQFSLPISAETEAHTLIPALEGWTISLGVNSGNSSLGADPLPENQLPTTGPTPLSLLFTLTAAVMLGIGLVFHQHHQ